MEELSNVRLRALWNELNRQEEQMVLEQRALTSIWQKVCEENEKNASERTKLTKEAVDLGMDFVEDTRPICLNVGGKRFETTAGILTSDRFSILAAICQTGESRRRLHEKYEEAGSSHRRTLTPDEDGSYFIDRDWWIFQHIMVFLGNALLPDDPLLLEEMYTEAMFYRLQSLRRAIEARQAAAVHSMERSEATRQRRADEEGAPHPKKGTNNERTGNNHNQHRISSLRHTPATNPVRRSHYALPDPYGFSRLRL